MPFAGHKVKPVLPAPVLHPVFQLKVLYNRLIIIVFCAVFLEFIIQIAAKALYKEIADHFPASRRVPAKKLLQRIILSYTVGRL